MHPTVGFSLYIDSAQVFRNDCSEIIVLSPLSNSYLFTVTLLWNILYFLMVGINSVESGKGYLREDLSGWQDFLTILSGIIINLFVILLTKTLLYFLYWFLTEIILFSFLLCLVALDDKDFVSGKWSLLYPYHLSMYLI